MYPAFYFGIYLQRTVKLPGYCKSLLLLTNRYGETTLSKEGEGRITIENPQLWWVNGLGEQALLPGKSHAFLRQSGSGYLGERRIGLRTMTMKREKDEWGVELCS